MKSIFTSIALAVFGLFLTLDAVAQSPEKISYQAVVRNSAGALITAAPVGMRISILQGSAEGSAVYVETCTPTTNANGLAVVEIGAGNAESGNFASINWAAGTYFIKTETDPSGGTNYTITGISQMLSVPYALHAKTAESIAGELMESDPLFEQSVAAGITATDTANWNNKLDSYTETDPQFVQSVAAGITATDTAAWNAKLDSYTETDPQFVQSVAAGITATDTAVWNAKQDALTAGQGISISGNTISTATAIPHYQIGDFAQGGIVFWVDETGQHGLVCAKEDQNPGIRWYAGTIGSTQAKGNGPMAGEANTAIIIAAHVAIGDDDVTYAARVCNEAKIIEGGKTYGDWYLPSQDELKLMHTHRALIEPTAIANGGAAFVDNYYWSSTELNGSMAQRLNFECGCPGSNNKSGTYRVRAVRTF